MTIKIKTKNNVAEVPTGATITTKYDLGNEVYFLRDYRVIKGVVTGISLEAEEDGVEARYRLKYKKSAMEIAEMLEYDSGAMDNQENMYSTTTISEEYLADSPQAVIDMIEMP